MALLSNFIFWYGDISSDYLGHVQVSRSWINIEVTVANQRQRAGLRSPRCRPIFILSSPEHSFGETASDTFDGAYGVWCDIGGFI